MATRTKMKRFVSTAIHETIGQFMKLNITKSALHVQDNSGLRAMCPHSFKKSPRQVKERSGNENMEKKF